MLRAPASTYYLHHTRSAAATAAALATAAANATGTRSANGGARISAKVAASTPYWSKNVHSNCWSNGVCGTATTAAAATATANIPNA